MNSELTQYLQDSWKAIIDADVDGPNAEPAKIDADKPLFGQRSLTRRLARTVFFGAAPTIGSAHKGLETQRVFLGTAIPGDVPGNFHSALDRARRPRDLLLQRGRQVLVRPAGQHLPPREGPGRAAAPPRTSAPRSSAASTARPRPAASSPASTSAPRTRPTSPTSTRRGWSSCTPSSRTSAASATPTRSRSPRARPSTAARRTGRNRNMLVYLAGDRDRIEELERSVRDYLGWSEILAKEDDLDLTTSQRNQATERRAKASETTDARLLGAYQWALVPTGQPIEIQATKVEGQATSLAERVSRRLGNDGALTVQHAAPAIRHQLDTTAAKLWADGHVTVGDALAALRRVPVHAAAARPRGARRRASPGRSCCGSRRASRSPTATTRRARQVPRRSSCRPTR